MTKQEARAVLKKANWRDEIIELVCDHEHCEYCGDPARSETNFWRMTTDHIIPGAGYDPSNLALACARCNSRKRNRLPPDLANLTKDELSTMERSQKVELIRQWLEATRKKDVKPTEQEQFEAFRVLWQE